MDASPHVFLAGNLDAVFSGQVHNHQRSFPLTFRIAESSKSLAKDSVPTSVKAVCSGTIAALKGGQAKARSEASRGLSTCIAGLVSKSLHPSTPNWAIGGQV